MGEKCCSVFLSFFGGLFFFSFFFSLESQWRLVSSYCVPPEMLLDLGEPVCIGIGTLLRMRGSGSASN